MIHANLLEVVVECNDLASVRRCKTGKHRERFLKNTVNLRAQSVQSSVEPQFPNLLMDVHDVVVAHNDVFSGGLDAGEATLSNEGLSESGSTIGAAGHARCKVSNQLAPRERACISLSQLRGEVIGPPTRP